MNEWVPDLYNPEHIHALGTYKGNMLLTTAQVKHNSGKNSRAASSNMVATRHMQLFTFKLKLIEIKWNKSFSSSVA